MYSCIRLLKSEIPRLYPDKINYSLCCKPRLSTGCPPPPPCGCSGGNRIHPPPDCRPPGMPPNPCVPQVPHSPDSYKKFRFLTLFVCLPLIFFSSIFILYGHEEEPPPPCRNYEFMRIRTKRFPWGDGNKSLFHNDKVNPLPGECEPPPIDCD